jgi:hypothetical protein
MSAVLDVAAITVALACKVDGVSTDLSTFGTEETWRAIASAKRSASP